MQHETNTFAPSKADFRVFELGGAWPPFQSGAALFAPLAGANIPISGAIEALRGANNRLVPLAWAAASPSAHVTDDAFERIVGALIAQLHAAGPLDGVYLDLHGAMVTESLDDGEGEILRRVREVVGPRVPVVASLDLHANVTDAMVAHADSLSAYRTYPHVDMASAGARAATLLMRMVNSGERPAKSFQRFDYLTGLPAQCTMIEPAKGLYELLERIEGDSATALSFTPGFPMADFAQCSMSALAYGAPTAAASALQCFAAAVADAEPQFVMGLLIDAESARRAHEAGIGATLEFALGETSGLPGHSPLRGTFTVERLGDGKFECTGPMFKGFRMTLGPMALLRCEGVRVILASRKVQAADQEMFRCLGVEPVSQRIVALKSAVHFRADFEPIAGKVLVVRSPGPALADPADFEWRRLRPGIRLGPLGPAFVPPLRASSPPLRHSHERPPVPAPSKGILLR
ncbi:MAG: M81 family metallopeptidase [Burkholderiaceae bacterium]|nr:M81 family metallopeptidase [Burkholderiaceae bacterium]